MNTHALRRRIRLSKEDSAFVYFILEAHEGVTMYSTVDHRAEERHTDLELLYTPDFEAEVEEILARLSRMVYPLPGTEVAPGP